MSFHIVKTKVRFMTLFFTHLFHFSGPQPQFGFLKNFCWKQCFSQLQFFKNNLKNRSEHEEEQQKSDVIWQMMMRLMYTIRHECPICRAIYLRHGYFLPKIFSISSQKLDYNTVYNMAAMPWEGKICIPRTTYVSMKKNQLLYNQFYTSLILMHFDALAKKSQQRGTWFMDKFIS